MLQVFGFVQKFFDKTCAFFYEEGAIYDEENHRFCSTMESLVAATQGASKSERSLDVLCLSDVKICAKLPVKSTSKGYFDPHRHEHRCHPSFIPFLPHINIFTQPLHHPHLDSKTHPEFHSFRPLDQLFSHIILLLSIISVSIPSSSLVFGFLLLHLLYLHLSLLCHEMLLILLFLLDHGFMISYVIWVNSWLSHLLVLFNIVDVSEFGLFCFFVIIQVPVQIYFRLSVSFKVNRSISFFIKNAERHSRFLDQSRLCKNFKFAGFGTKDEHVNISWFLLLIEVNWKSIYWILEKFSWTVCARKLNNFMQLVIPFAWRMIRIRSQVYIYSLCSKIIQLFNLGLFLHFVNIILRSNPLSNRKTYWQVKHNLSWVILTKLLESLQFINIMDAILIGRLTLFWSFVCHLL